MKMVKWLFILTALCLNLSAARATERGIVVLPLKHSLPEQVQSTVQAILPEGASATTYGSQLILKVTPEEQSNVEQLLRQIDIPARQLMISVRTPNSLSTSQGGISASGSFANGKIQTGNSTQSGQVIIRSNSAENIERQQQNIRATEGIPAYIAVGESVPVTTYRRDTLGRRETVTEYKQADKGFYVTAHLVGETVIMDISQTNDQHQQNKIATERLSTQINGPLGQWITIGNTDSNTTTSQGGLVIRSSDASKRSSSIQLRVEELK